jgi:GAF domain-containing protein
MMGEVRRVGRSPEAKLDALYRLGQALVLLRDEQTIVDTVLEIAEEVLDFQDSEFLLMDEARRELVAVAQRGELHLAAGLRIPLDGERGITATAARTGQPVYVPDVRGDPRYVHAGFPAVSELAVPVQIEGRLLGAINVESREPDAFTHADVRLLSTLASQAALALENARLYGQERRRVEELAAVNRVARRVSGSLDLRETLDGIVEAVAELVPCTLAEISLWDEKRQVLTLQALRCGPERAFPIGEVYPPGQGYTGWVVRHRQALLVPDVDAREDIRPDLLPGELPFKAYVGLPLLARDELIGTLVLVHDRANAFADEDLRLLEPLAGQAAFAIRNARLYEELACRHRELAALNAVAAAINQPLPLQEIMDQAVATVSEVMETEAAGVRLLDQATGELAIVSFQGVSPEGIRDVDRLYPEGQIMDRMAELREPRVVRDPAHDPRLANLGAAPEGSCAVAIAPLRVKEQTVGVLEVSTRRRREFTAEELDLLTAIGHQLGVAIENARLRQEALETERLAAVGRMAGTVAHDLRGPLGGIIRSAEFLARPELSDATRQKLSRAVVAMARRLINTAQELLDYTRGGRIDLHLALCTVPGFLEQVIEVLRVDLSDRGIEVVTEWGYTGDVWMDPDRMAQVVYNIAANARDAMPEGGQLTIATRWADEWVEFRFTDTGPGVPPEIAGRIFQPFVSFGKREGAGLGLAIARRIVREHGGEIDVECPTGGAPTEGGATFVVQLPLAERAAPMADPPAGSIPAA